MWTQLQQTVSKITLTLDTPQSVRTQIKQLNQAKRELALLRKQINAEIRAVNSNASHTSPDTFFSTFFDAFGDKRAAGRNRAHRRRQIQSNKQTTTAPLQTLKLYIDSVNLHIEQLKLIAQQYLDDPTITPSIPPTPPIPTTEPANTTNPWQWFFSIGFVIGGISALGKLSLWSWLSSPFLILAGLGMMPPLRPKIQEWFEVKTGQTLNENIINALVIVSLALGVLFMSYAEAEL